jgi:integration host factor subunit beta
VDSLARFFYFQRCQPLTEFRSTVFLAENVYNDFNGMAPVSTTRRFVVNKSELIEQLAANKNLSYKKAEEIVNLVFDAMLEELAQGGRIEIRGFGSFIVKDYKSYLGRNPKTGESIVVPPKRLPFFKVGKELRERVDKSSS